VSLVESDDFRAAITENMGLIWSVVEDGKISRREGERVATALVVSLAERAGQGHTKEQLVAELLHKVNGWLVDLFTRSPEELEARASQLEQRGKDLDRVAELRRLAAERRAGQLGADLEVELEDDERVQPVRPEARSAPLPLPPGARRS
jgi:polyhydroxyalkanoate synthesis regulator phasin